jgi:CRP-like cAMP-binding protein
MQVRPALAVLGVTDPGLLDPYLERRRYARGERIMAQGTGGTECYLIQEGEVRLEVERPDFDSDGVIAYLGPGMLCGEFSLLDGRPRSASAYAHTEVTALALSEDGLGRLCRDDPATGLAVLRSLGRDAAAKARETRRHLEEYVFAAEIDPAVDEVVARAAAAQAVLAGWPEARVEALLDGVARAVADRAEELAAATVAETGIGNVADKTFKNRFASLEVNRTLQGRPGIGPRPPDDRGVTEIASPVGVVLGLIPMTNPVATLVFKTLICLKARNALIVSHHPAAVEVGARTVELIGAVLADHGAPAALLQSVERASRTRTAMFMRHPEVSLILATGGAAMVKAAYSSGTPAIGVGSGNVPALVCADAEPPPPRWSRARPSTTASSAAPRTTWSSTPPSGDRSGPRWRRPGRPCARPRRRPGWPPTPSTPATGTCAARPWASRARRSPRWPGSGATGRSGCWSCPWRRRRSTAPWAGRSWPRCCRWSAWTGPSRAWRSASGCWPTRAPATPP